MAHRLAIRVYSAEGEFICRISSADADEKLASGLYEEHFEERGDGSTTCVGIRRRGGQLQETSGSDRSPCTLTANDMLVNALAEGLRQAGRSLAGAEGRLVAEIQDKIAAWPSVDFGTNAIGKSRRNGVSQVRWND